MNKNSKFTYRIATEGDIPEIRKLMRLSIEENMKEFLSAEQIEANKESMGVDQILIDDGTYFVVETQEIGVTIIVGCGGWGKRKTLYGGNQTKGRDDSLSDPEYEPARIRAMYTHPDWTRQGIGSFLLDLGEEAARNAGFRMIELGSTIPGYPLYLAYGYIEVSRHTKVAANGHKNTIIKMEKPL